MRVVTTSDNGTGVRVLEPEVPLARAGTLTTLRAILGGPPEPGCSASRRLRSTWQRSSAEPTRRAGTDAACGLSLERCLHGEYDLAREAVETWGSQMPLPAVDDEQLLSELRVVITAGSHLPSRPANAPDLPALLLFARARPNEPFSSSAVRLLEMLDRALLEGTRFLSDDALVAEDRVRGLRILFGTHPDYAGESAMVRRINAGEYPGPRQSRSTCLVT